MTRFTCCTAIVAALASVAAGEEMIDVFPTRRVNPDYPNALVERRVEGWSAITFRIAQSGEVEDAFVSDSSGEPALDAAALHAVERWRYESSEFDRCGVQVRLSWQLGARVPATSAKRVRRFDEAIARGDIDSAREELDAFRPRALGGVLQRDLLRARLAARVGDAAAEAVALERVTGARDPASFAEMLARVREMSPRAADPLTYEAQIAALSSQVRALVAARQYGRAAEIARGLREAGALPEDLIDVATQLEAMPESEGRIRTPGIARRLAASKSAPSHWRAPLTRSRFRLEPESGEVTRAELCCSPGALDFKPGTDVQVPEGAGACSVQVRGSEGARFTLIEPPVAN